MPEVPGVAGVGGASSGDELSGVSRNGGVSGLFPSGEASGVSRSGEVSGVFGGDGVMKDRGIRVGVGMVQSGRVIWTVPLVMLTDQWRAWTARWWAAHSSTRFEIEVGPPSIQWMMWWAWQCDAGPCR
jgi:hypothetical protein